MANVTIYDIAKKCGCAPSTVSKVINHYSAIPQSTKNRIIKVMKQMNYIPNVGAKSLSKRASRNIGVLAYFGMNISPFRHALFTDILDAAQTYVNAAGYDLLFISHNVDGRDGSFYENCISRAVAGTFLFGDMANPEIQEVANSKIPSVAFDYHGEATTGVSSDNYAEMKALTNHLIGLGHKDIVFVHGEQGFFTQERIRGFKEALEEAGIPIKDDSLVPSRYLDLPSARNITKNIIHRVNPPTAIMYADDRSAMAALQSLREEGLKCPADISITGFDGIDESQIVSPSLTTIKQDTENIGKTLARKLIDLIEKKSDVTESIVIRASLLIGESTGPVKQ